MAIYHLSVKPISRAGGRSATAAAAYRSGELVHDLNSGDTFDYTRKRGVEHTEIVLPTAAAKRDIHWARDRQQLWNAAESAENRSNSRVAREYEVALPHEMNSVQRVRLVQAFSQSLADRYGVAVDIAIHAPHRSGDDRNHHAHLLTTTRTIEAAGLGEKSQIEWSDTNRRKAGLGPAKEEITAIRESWKTLTNEHLRELGIGAQIDHRSLADQGIAREPQSHLGPAVSGMERRGMETQVGRRIAWERQIADQQRLERAAELGRLEREKVEVKQSIFDLSGDLKSARQERNRGAEVAPDRAPAPAKKRGMFDGLQLSSGASAGAKELFSEVRLSVPESPTRAPAAEALHHSVDRFARAWTDAARMQEKGLPILAHQHTELREAGDAVDRVRPGGYLDLLNTIQYEAGSRQAMRTLEGPPRVAQLIAGIEHEAQIRRDPALGAERLVKEWNVLEARRESVRGDEHRAAREQLQSRARELTTTLKRDPQLESILKQRSRELGIAPGSRLAQILHERDLKRALSLSDLTIGRHRGLSR